MGVSGLSEHRCEEDGFVVVVKREEPAGIMHLAEERRHECVAAVIV